MPKLMIVDDEEGYRQVLQTVFEAERYNVITFADGRAALDHLAADKCDLIISDVRMPDVDGIQLLKEAREIDPDIGVVLMTAFGTMDIAREAFKLGADDFIQKPFNNDELKTIVKRTIDKQAIINENRAFRRAQRNMGSLAGIIGRSPKMLELFKMIKMVAREHATILITGDSGTGKELVARAIHDLSDRADKPFIPINCGALTETLLESELFGYIKGAFTGAGESRPGMFEAANNGTIFLDEIGDMSQAMQVKILRVLQEQRVRRVGARDETPVDTRVITATNRDLGPMVEDGTFRRDLYYRVSVIPIHVPSLSERRDDIPLLAEHFIKKFSARSGKAVRLSKQALEILKGRPWNGNVRELEHAVERAVTLTADGIEIRPEYCAEDASAAHFRHIDLPFDGIHLPEVLNDIERKYVEEALSRTSHNQTRAAALLQIPVHALRHLLQKHEIK
ncbi:MAG: sigma-54-dependent Fis family transcriptional regulator [Acidobacteria bacterium]|nr:sigma-54-dependent Fis family transcriptional regulator [Acidobacteriota bacterium]